MGTGYCRMVFLLLGIPTKFSKPFWTCQTSSFHAFSSSRILQRFLWAFPWAQVSITTPSGEVKTQECLTGADIVVQVGDEVTKDEPITTNPNVGGFGQAVDVWLEILGVGRRCPKVVWLSGRPEVLDAAGFWWFFMVFIAVLVFVFF